MACEDQFTIIPWIKVTWMDDNGLKWDLAYYLLLSKREISFICNSHEYMIIMFSLQSCVMLLRWPVIFLMICRLRWNIESHTKGYEILIVVFFSPSDGYNSNTVGKYEISKSHFFSLRTIKQSQLISTYIALK